MMNIYINAAHTAFSPGGCFAGRTEYNDSCSFGQMVVNELKVLLPRTPLHFIKGNGDYSGFSENDRLIVLHRGTASRGEKQKGAFVTVAENADAQVQYEAYRMLDSITGAEGFRFLGVHTASDRCPLRRFREAVLPHRYVLTAGYVDNDEDNEIFDKSSPALARKLAAAISEICKETENEDKT